MTKKHYTEYLNRVGGSLDEDEFIIGGKFRRGYYPNRYGEALRRYDPIAFEVGYNEFNRKQT